MPATVDLDEDPAASGDEFYGFRPLPKRGEPVSNALVEWLREDDEED